MQVEKNVPLPAGGKSFYPFTTMEIGDSVLVESSVTSERRRVSNAAYMVGARDGKKFRAKSTGQGLRIWRIS